ncbi:MAG: hypothetical protein PF517_11370 [Salinivirgaceae bacterium]|jgi:hypothetical protein|nr:hypothetical protein [Salinivirgaceae bacterium]
MKSKLLLNPFEKIAGIQSLIFGIMAMLTAGIIGYFSNTHFDGVLNVHSGYVAPLVLHIIEPFTDWLFISLWFLIFGIIFSSSKVRAIDIFGTQAFAFIPLVPASFTGFFKVISNLSAKLTGVNPENLNIEMLPISELIAVIIIGMFAMALVIWSAIWMYNGFKISSNLPHKKVIPIYVSGIILGMIIPKYLFSLML